MHSHGHSFKVIATDGNLIPEVAQLTKDTITLHPSERYDIVITADNPGAWLFHCHQLHHAAAGMVVPFLYEGYEPCCLDEKEESHGAQEAIEECFAHHDDDTYQEALEHCQQDICDTDEHCFQEVEELSEVYNT